MEINDLQYKHNVHPDGVPRPTKGAPDTASEVPLVGNSQVEVLYPSSLHPIQAENPEANEEEERGKDPPSQHTTRQHRIVDETPSLLDPLSSFFCETNPLGEITDRELAPEEIPPFSTTSSSPSTESIPPFIDPPRATANKKIIQGPRARIWRVSLSLFGAILLAAVLTGVLVPRFRGKSKDDTSSAIISPTVPPTIRGTPPIQQAAEPALSTVSCAGYPVGTTRITSSSSFNNTIPTCIGLLSSLTYLRLVQGLQGAIPTEVGLLTSLTLLRLDYNGLTGPLPAQLSLLTALTALELDHNELTGTLPIELAALTALTKLELNDNQLQGSIPQELQPLTSLVSLRLQNNRFTGSIPGWVKDVPSADVSGNNLNLKRPLG